MTTISGEGGHSTLEAIGEEAQRALRERPSISIRTRVAVGFFLWLISSLGITIISIITISQIRDKLYFMEAAGTYTFEVQQARRFEKNYFLYQTNLEDALEHVHNARKILIREGENMAAVVGAQEYETMAHTLTRYDELLYELKKESGPTRLGVIETELRRHGAEMVSVAEELVAKERESVSSMLIVSQRIPMVFLLLLTLLIVYFAVIVARHVLAPLNRLVQASAP